MNNDIVYTMSIAGIAKRVNDLLSENVELLDKNIARAREAEEVDQILGKALGYPEGFPEVNAVDDGWVNTGPHTIASLADEAVEFMYKQCDLVDAVQKLSCERANELDEATRRIASLNAKLGTTRYELAESVSNEKFMFGMFVLALIGTIVSPFMWMFAK
jgi:hypothetical protein